MTLTDDGPRLAAEHAGGRPAAPWVTAVLVSHDGARWLPRTIAALTGQRRPPDAIVAVDTGSTDQSVALLEQAFGTGRIVRADRRTGFGDAVRLGLAHRSARPSVRDASGSGEGETGPAGDTPRPERDGPGPDWIWLLHDDSAPAPDALDVLLDVASRSAQVGVVGPKLIEWDDPTQLVEAGLTVSRGGRRSSGVDGVERDQGQHDHRTDVLAVGTAGMLVRGDVWAELGGLDPALPLLRDDIDLCWRAQLAGHRVVLAPKATVADAQGTVRGLRRADLVRGSLGRADRQRGLQVALARCSVVALPGLIAWTMVAAVIRGVGLVALKEPRRGRDELLAAVVALGTPWRWCGSRWRARGTRRVARRDIGGLFLPRTAGLRRVLDWWGALGARDRDEDAPANPGETGPSADDLVLTTRSSPIRRLLAHPLTAVLVLVGAATVLAWRRLLGAVLSGDALTGGQLGRITGRPADLWHAAVDSWHGGGFGTDQAASPAAFARALGAVLLTPFGAAEAAPRAVALLLVLAAPAAALAAYLALTGLVRSRWVRAWAALAWAGIPVLTAAVGEGRLGPVAAAVLVPLVAGALVRALSPGRAGAVTATFAGSLGVALLTAAVPVLLVPVALVALGALVVGRAAVRLRALVLLVLPLGLLGPWLGALVTDPRLLLGGPGAVQALPAGAASSGGRLLVLPDLVRLPQALATRGVPDWAALALLAPVAVVGALALLRAGRRGRLTLAGWLLGLVALAGALVAPDVVVARVGDVQLRPWSGGALLVVTLVVVATAVVASDGVVQWLSRHRFGWRQALVAPLTLLVVAGPVVALGLWAWRGADDPLADGGSGSLPAVAQAAAQGPAAVRTLVLTVPTGSTEGGALEYELVGAEPGAWARDLPAGGTAAGAGGTGRAAEALQGAVRAVVDGPGAPGAATAGAPSTAQPATVADLLGRLAVGFVMVRGASAADLPRDLVTRLDGTAGLVRIGAPSGSVVWRVGLGGLGTGGSVQDQPARVRIETAQGRVLGTVAARGGHAAVDTSLAAASGRTGQRLLVLSEPASPRWHARLDGTELPVAAGHASPWRQAFVLPAGGGRLVVDYRDPVQHWWRIAQAVLAGLTVLLALPSRRGPDRVHPGGAHPDDAHPDDAHPDGGLEDGEPEAGQVRDVSEVHALEELPEAHEADDAHDVTVPSDGANS